MQEHLQLAQMWFIALANAHPEPFLIASKILYHVSQIAPHKNIESGLQQIKDENGNSLTIETLQTYIKRCLFRLMYILLYKIRFHPQHADEYYAQLYSIKLLEDAASWVNPHSPSAALFSFHMKWEEIHWEEEPLTHERIVMMVADALLSAKEFLKEKLQLQQRSALVPPTLLERHLATKLNEMEIKYTTFCNTHNIPEKKTSEWKSRLLV